MHKRRFLTPALLPLIAVTAYLLTSGLVHAQASATSATVQFSNGDTITVTDFSTEIGVQPSEFINITLQFPPEDIGQPVVIEALDGGSTSVGSSIPVIAEDGTLSFAFGAPASTGAKPVGVRIGSTAFALRFSVANASRP